jgi:hypothetical protein
MLLADTSSRRLAAAIPDAAIANMELMLLCGAKMKTMALEVQANRHLVLAA